MINPMALNGKRILVTGGSSGIGRETAVILSRLGAKVVIAGRNRVHLSATLELLDNEGHAAESVDLSELENIPEWLEHVATANGPLDGLVHSAGLQIMKPLRALTDVDVESLMKINLLAAINLAKGFRKRGVVGPEGGSIVFVASVMGLVGSPGQSLYSATKGALIAMSRSLALELARERIRVNCVAPAMVRTEMMDKMFQSLLPQQVATIEQMHPLGLGLPSDVAHSIAFLLADSGRWITGTTLAVDGGYTAQ